MDATPSLGPAERAKAWLSMPDGGPRQRRYLLAAALGTLVIWSLALAVVASVPRTYTVESSLILPSSDPDARVDLKETGQAYATSRSTYDSKSLDPRVNYKEIMLSANVLEAASRAASVPEASFGEPRIKLIDQSSVMEIKMNGGSAQQALDNARALLAAFQNRLSELRRDELAQREQAIEQAIRNSRAKLDSAQRDLVKFKVGAQIVSEKQLEEVALQSTALLRRRIELDQKLAHDRATVQSLSRQLGLPPRLAGVILSLQGDAVFLEHFRQLAGASALLSDSAHKWDELHPKVREATGFRDSALAAMAARARVVLNEPLPTEDLRRLAMVLQDRSRDQLLRDLVTTQAAGDAAVAESAEIERQRARLAAQLPKLAGESAQLDELKRRVDFSEAVFTGAIGKTDVGHTNIFSSYPMVQTLVAPTLPVKASSPRFSYIAAGALMASMLLTVGLSLAWLRHKR